MIPVVRFLIALCGVATATAADAQPLADARLVGCGAADCVLLRGDRATPATIVSVNGHRVAATGGRAWQVRLPIATVRDWSPPHARTIRIATAAPDGTNGRDEVVRLPVGLLGGGTELAALVVRAR